LSCANGLRTHPPFLNRQKNNPLCKTRDRTFQEKKIRDDVKAILTKYGDSIDKLVTFGSDLIDWDLTREGVEKKDGYLVPILFLRNLIENIDAIGILILQGASDPSKSLPRTVLENFYSLEYLLDENEHERSMSFHILEYLSQL